MCDSMSRTLRRHKQQQQQNNNATHNTIQRIHNFPRERPRTRSEEVRPPRHPARREGLSEQPHVATSSWDWTDRVHSMSRPRDQHTTTASARACIERSSECCSKAAHEHETRCLARAQPLHCNEVSDEYRTEAAVPRVASNQESRERNEFETALREERVGGDQLSGDQPPGELRQPGHLCLP